MAYTLPCVPPPSRAAARPPQEDPSTKSNDDSGIEGNGDKEDQGFNNLSHNDDDS